MEYFCKFSISINFNPEQPKEKTNPNQKSQLDEATGNTSECCPKTIIYKKKKQLLKSQSMDLYVNVNLMT